MKKSLYGIAVAMMLAVLSGCTITPSVQYQTRYNDRGYATQGYVYGNYDTNYDATVVSIKQVAYNSTSGVGALGGAVVGGAIGNRFGGGTGKTLSTVAGVLVGAAVGNSLEAPSAVAYVYEVVLRADNGNMKTVVLGEHQDVRYGDRVTVRHVNGNVVLYRQYYR
jgi:outer membrane lipoprotein SlyB